LSSRSASATQLLESEKYNNSFVLTAAITGAFVDLFAKFKSQYEAGETIGGMRPERDGPFFVESLRCSNDPRSTIIMHAKEIIAPVPTGPCKDCPDQTPVSG
jgi:hypothetical protein